MSISSSSRRLSKLVALPLYHGNLPVQFRPLLAGEILFLTGPGTKHPQNPIADLFILNPQLGKQGENLGHPGLPLYH